MSKPGISPRDPFWKRHRGLYPALERFTYLNNASIQPLPVPVAEALHRFVQTATEGDPDTLYDNGVPGRFRASMARWLGCSERDLALVTSTSDGLIKAVNSVAWAPGDEVVLPHNEFPSVVYPFRMAQAAGASVRFAGQPGRPVTEEDLLSAIGPRTRAVAFSWVSFSTGYKMDLVELPKALKSKGVEFVIVDGMQGAGVWDPALANTNVDFFSFQAVKWVAGPGGIGTLYVRPDLWRTLKNPSFSWYSVPACEDYALLTHAGLAPFESARCWDGGTPPWIQMVGVQAYLDLLEPAGPEGVTARMNFLLDALRSRLDAAGVATLVPLGSPHRSSIALLEVDDAAALHAGLKEAGVLTALRMGRVRVSPHVYNEEEDFGRLVEILSERA